MVQQQVEHLLVSMAHSRKHIIIVTLTTMKDPQLVPVHFQVVHSLHPFFLSTQ